MQTFKTTPFGFRPWRLMLATLVLALAGGVAQTAVAAPPEGLPPGMGPGPHGMHPGMRPGMQRQMHPGPEMAGGGVRFLGRMLDLAKATPEQRSQINQIMDAAQVDLKAQREAGRKLARPDAPAVHPAHRRRTLPSKRCASRCWPSMTRPASA
jgi:hypothetical protein